MMAVHRLRLHTEARCLQPGVASGAGAGQPACPAQRWRSLAAARPWGSCCRTLSGCAGRVTETSPQIACRTMPEYTARLIARAIARRIAVPWPRRAGASSKRAELELCRLCGRPPEDKLMQLCLEVGRHGCLHTAVRNLTERGSQARCKHHSVKAARGNSHSPAARSLSADRTLSSARAPSRCGPANRNTFSHICRRVASSTVWKPYQRSQVRRSHAGSAMHGEPPVQASRASSI